jgi:hypothetical protein
MCIVSGCMVLVTSTFNAFQKVVIFYLKSPCSKFKTFHTSVMKLGHNMKVKATSLVTHKKGFLIAAE